MPPNATASTNEAIFSGPRAEVSRVGSGKLGRKVENFIGEISEKPGFIWI